MIAPHPTPEAAIRSVVARLQDGFAKRSGAIYASAFAPHHDYVIVNGMLLTDVTREANAEVHQRMFGGSQGGALGGDLSRMEPRCEVLNLRFLTPEIAVVHIAMQTGGSDNTIATAVMQHQAGEWLIVALHNAHVHAGGKL